MRILIEEHTYEATEKIWEVAKDLVPNILVGDKVNFSYVGYYYNTTINDCVFILPKVLLEDVNGEEKVFGNHKPEDIIHLESKDNPLRDDERRFIYELSVWIYRAICVFKEDNKDSEIVLHKRMAEIGQEQRHFGNTFLDIILSLIQFYRNNQDFFFFTIKNLHSGHNKINWTKTIAHSQAIIQSGQPIYLNPVNKRRQVNFDEELMIIYFSILNYIHKEYGFPFDTECHYELITDLQFKSYLKGRGKARMREIKYKYFSDKALQLWELCYAFFDEARQINVSTKQKEFLLVKNFYVVFEAMIDKLIGDSKEKLPDYFKEQKDGKLVDHLYTYPGLIEADEEQKTYYIGDSKYYKIGGSLGDTSIYKQYTYARNIVQYNIDLWLNRKDGESEPEVKLRDDLTEGYNIIPNFFISAAMKKDDFSYNHREIELTNVSDKKNPEIQFQFKDRLFDRDTMLLSRYNVNFLFVLSLYARNKQSERDAWKEEVRKQFRDKIREVLENEYSFYPMRPKGVVLEDYITKHFYQLNGKVFTPFQDKEILTLALHTPPVNASGDKELTQGQVALIDMLKHDFDVDEHYKLGKEPQLPPRTNIQFNFGDYVLVGYYKSEEQLRWIFSKNHYNVRAGKDRGSLDLSSNVCAARFLLLYGKNGTYKFRMEPNSVRVWDKVDMKKDGYPNPYHDFYLVFSIEEQMKEGEFAEMTFNMEKLKVLLNKYGKDYAGHDKGAVAVPFSELVDCKIKSDNSK